jgi:hypothetical protein
LSAVTVSPWNNDDGKNEVLAFKTLNDLIANSDIIFQKSLEVNLLYLNKSATFIIYYMSKFLRIYK